MRRYYDAHLYFANWGADRIMFRLPRALLSPATAEQYCVDPYVTMSVTREHVILDLTSEDEAGDWAEDYEDSLSAYGGWERDEDAFDEDDEDVTEPPVPAGLGSLTAPQRALADFLPRRRPAEGRGTGQPGTVRS